MADMDAELEAAGLLQMRLCTLIVHVIIVELCLICDRDYKDEKFIDCSNCKKRSIISAIILHLAVII